MWATSCNLCFAFLITVPAGYTVMAARYITGQNPTEVISATATLLGDSGEDAKIDVATSAVLSFPEDVTAEVQCHSMYPGWGPFDLLPSFPVIGIEAKCEGGDVVLSNFVSPHYLHSITVSPKRGRARSETAYTFKDGPGEPWWSS